MRQVCDVGGCEPGQGEQCTYGAVSLDDVELGVTCLPRESPDPLHQATDQPAPPAESIIWISCFSLILLDILALTEIDGQSARAPEKLVADDKGPCRGRRGTHSFEAPPHSLSVKMGGVD